MTICLKNFVQAEVHFLSEKIKAYYFAIKFEIHQSAGVPAFIGSFDLIILFSRDKRTRPQCLSLLPLKKTLKINKKSQLTTESFENEAQINNL